VSAPFTCSIPVRFADVDHAGIVYYPRFFHYFHVAFEELWRTRLGARAYVKLLDEDRVGFPAVRAECDYTAPLRFGDTADVELSVERLGRSSITFRYRVWRAAEPESERSEDDHARARERLLVASGRTICAVVDLARFVAIPAPERIAALLADLVEPGAS